MANASEEIRIITLADGSEWNGSVLLSGEKDFMWVTLDEGYVLSEAFLTFNNPENTVVIKTTIKSMNNPVSDEREYRNFTRMTDIRFEGTKIMVRLWYSVLPDPDET